MPPASVSVPVDTVPSFRNDGEAVLAQLERIVDSAAFRNSKRYPRFLRFIVEQALLGRAESLKERLLGIEVFDRPPDYDLAVDPIVRVAAGEIRKRLAQYYVESGHESELRIHLAPGSYVPEFHFSSTATVTELSIKPAAGLDDTPSAAPPAKTPKQYRWAIPTLATVLLVLTALPLYWVRSTNPIREFWKPFLGPSSSPVICIGDLNFLLAKSGDPDNALAELADDHEYLPIADVQSIHLISSVLAKAGKPVVLTSAYSASISELSQRPAILIGGAPNPWTMREMKFLPLQLVQNFTPGLNGILKRDDRSKLMWQVNVRQPLTAMQKQYAIVARFQCPETGQLTLIAAGVGAVGQLAAAQFLTNPAYLKEYIKHAPKSWRKKNLEIILETQMINGIGGPPRVVETTLW